jgi:membrane protein implicated in regulation of membrane protease activity
MVGDPSVIGRTGVLVVATRGPQGPGEVEIRIRGGVETFLALSDAPLPRGASVLVIGSNGPRTVEVVPWLNPAAVFGGDL